MNLADFMKVKLRVLLVGPPGIGKTARVLSAASRCNYRAIIMRASLCERVDFGGCLIPDVSAGITRTLPMELLHDLRATKIPTLLFLDDLGQAPVDVQAALMRMFDENELSPSVLIWGATNRPGDRAGVVSLCEPLRSRFDMAFSIAVPPIDSAQVDNLSNQQLSDWKTELSQWANWAIDHNSAPEIIAWHRATNGRTLYTWKPCADPAHRMADYRSWGVAMKMWGLGMRDLESYAACLGPAVAAEFLAFASLVDEIPTPDQVRIDPMGARIPNQAGALFLITSMLSAQCEARDLRPFASYASRLDPVYSALFFRDAFRKHAAKLSGTPEWVKWHNDNQELFSV